MYIKHMFSKCSYVVFNAVQTQKMTFKKKNNKALIYDHFDLHS